MEVESTNPPSQFDLVAWLATNFKQILIIVIAIVVIGAGFGLYSWNKERSELKANEQVFALPSIGLARSTASADTYLKAAQENSGNQVGKRAELLAADVLFRNGKYAEAQAQFEKFLKDNNSDTAMNSQAALGVAASVEAQGKGADAIPKYQDVVNRFGMTAAGSQAKLSLARLFETQSRPDQALKLYDELNKAANPYDPWRAVAVEKREQLLSKHPELSKAEAPAIQEQVFEVTTPPEGSTNAPIVKTNVVTPK
jgi:tetratricopeptide (TPR) repeat protein